MRERVLENAKQTDWTDWVVYVLSPAVILLLGISSLGEDAASGRLEEIGILGFLTAVFIGALLVQSVKMTD
ncbi:MAG: hypothetical protein J07HR59_00749 [Halorubrum sp. J07HR59]|nr:MAG: hypothetical protein J07HR59_00749 [Halorubrum sp. J07HR59]